MATRWHLTSRHRAPWKLIPPPGLTSGRGTAVRLTVHNQLSSLLDAGYLEEAIRRHFHPLLDPAFDELLRRHYPEGVRFAVDGRTLVRVPSFFVDRVPISIRLGRKRTPSAIGFIERHRTALPEERQGIAISTFGKVIKRGWDWLGLAPAARAQISGLIEAPDLAACLTLSKNDFIRTGPRGASYLAYRKAIQEVVSRQLALWGDGRDRDGEARPRTAKLERDLERVLEDLADEFPLLRSLVDKRAGGQKRLPMPDRGDERVPGPLFANVSVVREARSGEAPSTGEGHVAPLPSPDEGGSEGEPQRPSVEPSGATPPERTPPTPLAPAPVGDEPGVEVPAAVGTLETVPGRRRPARYGLLVQFESLPDNLELGRLVDSTIWINDAHPAYTRAASSRSLGYHTALAVALALAPLAVEARDEHAFVTQFLAHWGGARALTGARGGRRARKRA